MAKVLPSPGFVLTGTVARLAFCHRGKAVYARVHVVPREARDLAETSVDAAAHIGAMAWSRGIMPPAEERRRESTGPRSPAKSGLAEGLP